MSFLFDKKTKNAMKWVWVFFSVVIILSMTLAFSGDPTGLFGGNSRDDTQNYDNLPEQTLPDASELIINSTSTSESADVEPVVIPQNQ